MMKFSSMLAIVFAFIAVGSVHSTYMFSRDTETGDIDLSIALLGVSMVILFSILTFVFWRKSVLSKQKDEAEKEN